MSANCDAIVLFPIYGQFTAFRKPDSGTFYLTKTENKSNKSLTQLSYYCFEYRRFFWHKNADFLQKSADISKIKRVLVRKSIFSETT